MPPAASFPPPALLDLRPPVAAALARGLPVVALETAVLTHGLPARTGLQALRDMEDEVRAAGAIPAAVGVLGGRLAVGLEPAEREALAQDPGRAKASLRDLAVLLAQRRAAGTTVAATLRACRLAGIRVFATGGIGGVHRNWQLHPDLSADLAEIARAPVLTVSAGVKSVLDGPATLEVLEALGVPVLGWRCDRLPAFQAPGLQGPRLPHCVEEATEAACIARLHWEELDGGGVLLFRRVPAEAALDDDAVEAAVTAALGEARRTGVRGPDLTPFLLREMARATSGASLEANLALLRANARLAGEVAACLDRTSLPE